MTSSSDQNETAIPGVRREWQVSDAESLPTSAVLYDGSILVAVPGVGLVELRADGVARTLDPSGSITMVGMIDGAVVIGVDGAVEGNGESAPTLRTRERSFTLPDRPVQLATGGATSWARIRTGEVVSLPDLDDVPVGRVSAVVVSDDGTWFATQDFDRRISLGSTDRPESSREVFVGRRLVGVLDSGALVCFDGGFRSKDGIEEASTVTIVEGAVEPVVESVVDAGLTAGALVVDDSVLGLEWDDGVVTFSWIVRTGATTQGDGR